MDDETPFNPLDKRNLGESVVEALLERPPSSLANVPAFRGAGIYAIYYAGDYPAYQTLARENRSEPKTPIYVGKAIPKGARKGAALNFTDRSRALSKRLQEHEASIRAVSSLRIEDFLYRKLIVDDVWIALGEALVIEKFQPLWNVAVDGFGNHDPGAGRYGGKRPLWDELHPGRDWAGRCAPAKLNRKEILAAIARYFQKR
ncbi:MAG: Eco29kI family restriction endonuclease [Verrucomicrobiae bacterium]|nr:Eco29kI family restriction endonuclease [Verrucomicrobiae bacterium]